MLFSGSSITRPVAAVLLEELPGLLGLVVEGDADTSAASPSAAVGDVEGVQLRVLLEARDAPAGEEVDHHPAAAVGRRSRPPRRRSSCRRSAGASSPISGLCEARSVLGSRVASTATMRATSTAMTTAAISANRGPPVGPRPRRSGDGSRRLDVGHARAHRLADGIGVGRRRPPGRAPRSGRWAAGGGGRARRPAAVPKAITPPPIQSHTPSAG